MEVFFYRNHKVVLTLLKTMALDKYLTHCQYSYAVQTIHSIIGNEKYAIQYAG